MCSLIKNLALITLIIGIFFSATVGKYPVAVPDGARYAELPREMVVTGDYLTPHLNGVKYLEKPPLFYWLQAISIKIFGANELSVSIVNLLMALGCVILIYVTSRKLYGNLAGTIASFIFATSSLVFALTRIVTLDVTLTFFLTGSLSSFLLATELTAGVKRNLYLFAMYIFAACAVMTKGLIGIFFLGMIIIIWLTFFNEWRNLKTYHILTGIIVFLLLTLPWHILVQIKNPEFFRFYFIEQHFLRYFTTYANRSQPWWFLPGVLLMGLYPWLIFLPQTIYYHLPKHFNEWRQYKTNLFLLIWIIFIYIFYTFSNSKLIPYILPMFPPIAILLGNYLANNLAIIKNRSITHGFIALFILNLILSIGTVAATFILDFAKYTLTKQNLYVFALAIMLLGTSSIIIYRRYGLAKGVATIIIITATLWLYISPYISTINNQSIKPLITTLQQKIKPEDEVICYGTYYQDLPFYLNRIVTVADFTNELDFGTHHQDTTSWMINQKTFWERWRSNKTVYLLTSIDNYRALQPMATNKMRIVAKHFTNLLIVNKN